MSGFTKLVPEIVQSSIWNESPEVRVVWITLLAIKDENGYVRGSSKTISRIANVPDKFAEEALEKFQQPDPQSNTPDHDGRRIEAIPGGWFVINHSIYRAKDHKTYEADRKKEYRKKMLSGTCPGQVPDTSASASVSSSVKGEGVEGGGTQSNPHAPVDVGRLMELPGAVEFLKLNPLFAKISDAALENILKSFSGYREHWPKMLREYQTDITGVESLKHPPCRDLRIAFDRYVKFKKLPSPHQSN